MEKKIWKYIYIYLSNSFSIFESNISGSIYVYFNIQTNNNKTINFENSNDLA